MSWKTLSFLWQFWMVTSEIGLSTAANCPTSCLICSTENSCSICLDVCKLDGETCVADSVKCLNCSCSCQLKVNSSECPENCDVCSTVDGRWCNLSVFHCSRCIYRNDTIQCDSCQDGCYTENSTCLLCNCPTVCLDDCTNNGSSQICYTCLNFTSCQPCSEYNQSICLSCSRNYNTDSCTVPCSPNCNNATVQNICNITGQCINGRWWSSCNESCSLGCQKCERSSAECLQCELVYFVLVQSCEQECCLNCLDRNESSCTNDIGRSPQGCIGACCNTTSTTTVDTTVSTTTVEVTASSRMETSETADSTHPFDRSTAGNSTKENFHIEIIAVVSAGNGVMVLGLLIGIGVWCWKLYCRQKPEDKEQVMDMSIEDGQSMPLAHSSERSSCFDATDRRNAPSTHWHVGQNEVNQSSLGVADLEDIDDEMPSPLHLGKAPSADTYYNIEGLKRSRVMTSNLTEYIKGKKDFDAEFEKLPKFLTRTCHQALKSDNVAKNRYNGIYAYDATRVVLQNQEYINANYIDGYGVTRAYIGSLGPVKSAMKEFVVFWSMVWQENTEKIVMLTNLTEGGKMKCEQYWPDNGSTNLYGGFSITTESEEVYAEHVIRKLKIEKDTESRMVTHYHYTAWPDKSVPYTLSSLLEFRDVVEREKTPNAGPMIVHCSAGIGRTGTYIALDILIKEGLAENWVDIFGCVLALRGQRVCLVQNVVQYIYLHHCVVYALTCNPKPVDVKSLLESIQDSKVREQFQALQSLPELPKKAPTNKRKKGNRRGADTPEDCHRVRLGLKTTTHVNAVYVDGYRQQKKYIAAQTPTSQNVEEFLAMMIQENVAVIVDLEESPTPGVGQYILQEDNVAQFELFQMVCVHSQSEETFIVRELVLSKKGEPPGTEKKIKHYQIKGWKPDAGVPDSRTQFLHLILAVSAPDRTEKRSVLIQCLDGAKKSGLFCALAVMLEKLAAEMEVSIVNIVCQVRGRRRSAVQDFMQFRFCYRCIQEYLETSEAKTYYNLK